MLHLLYGPAASGKTDLLMGRIRTAVAARTPGQVLLVPEQYSHEAERALCAACGDSLSLYAEVLSFTGLARRVAAETGGSILVTTDAKEAVKDADCVFTDTWVSMGEEAEYAIRSKPFWDYQVNTELMALAKPDAFFQHCLPAYRGKEVTAEVIDGPQSVVWDEAENRLHAQKALLTWLTGKARGDESLLA